MQPVRRRPRRILQELRPAPPLAYDKLSDPILVHRAKDGDERALAALVERHAPRVERISRHVLGDGEDARDGAQEALAKVCAKLPQFRGEAAFSTWLHRLTVNACRDVAQRQWSRRTEPLDDDARTAGDVGPSRHAELSELRAELREGLAGLPAVQARVLVLKDALGFSFEEISDASGMPVGTAKCYAHRGRAGMRDLLPDHVEAAP
jgi:RNA polymerase sigma-70 factor, ECF subfamily